MSRRTVLKTSTYSIYANGDVYISSDYRFTISEDRVFDYIWERNWVSSKQKETLDALLKGYPDSFGFLYQEVRPSEKIDLGAEIEKSLRT